MHLDNSGNAWPVSLSELGRLFDPATLRRGQGYVSRVLGLEGSDTVLRAQVAGSEFQPYRTEIERVPQGNGRPYYRMVCSCPVGGFCKHAVAVLLRYAEQRQSHGPDPLVLEWARGVRAALVPQAKPGKAAKAPQSRLFYRLVPESSLRGELRLSIGKARVDAQGLPAGEMDAWNNVEQALVKPFAFLTDEDVHALQLLQRAAKRAAREGFHGPLDLGASAGGGADLLHALLATRRLVVMRGGLLRNLQRVELAPPRQGEVAWVADAQGRQRAEVRVDGGAAARAFALDDTWFLDEDQAVLGPLQIDGVPAPLLRQLFKLPPLREADLPVVAAVLEELVPAVPRPAFDAALPTIRPRLVPRLLLDTATQQNGLYGVANHRGYGAGVDRSFSHARLFWHYRGEGEQHWQLEAATGPTEPVMFMPLPEGGTLRLQRDTQAEQEARGALVKAGFKPVPPSRLYMYPQPPGLWGLHAEADWGEFFLREVPQLRAAGWEIETTPHFAHRRTHVETWHLDVEPDAEAGGAEWLVSMGVELADGRRLDLAPLLARLLRQDPSWLDATKLQRIKDDQLVDLIDAEGTRIAVEAGRLKPIVRALVDLFDGPEPDGPLRLSRWDAARLAELDDAQRWQFKGDASVRELAQRLRSGTGVRPVKPPKGLGIKLRPYQREGLAWLQYLREQSLAGILADDMGLGKTAQTLAHVLAEKQAGRLDRPALVVLPTSLVFNWRAEAQRIAPALRVLTLHGKERIEQFSRVPENDLVLTTYALLWRDIEALAAHEYHLLVLDEAQSVKNAASRGAEAVRRLQARHRLCLTGTPLENHLGELWTQFDFLLPGFLGDGKSFTKQWRTPIEKRGDGLRAGLLARRVKPFVLRRRKEDVATELPPKTLVVRRVALAGRQRDLYETVRLAVDEDVRRAVAAKGFARSQIAVLDALLKLRQVCCDPLLVKRAKVPKTVERAKMELLREMLPELVSEGRRVLLFSQFTEMLELVEAELPSLGIPWVKLTGETRRRAEVVASFQQGEAPLFLISLKAGGVGLNLTAADTVIHVDPWWNPAAENQATDRAHRIGQDKPVFVYKLVVEGSIEERILDLQERKARLAAGVLSDDAAGTVKFGPEDIEALLAPLT